jgi:hypothetical protein
VHDRVNESASGSVALAVTEKLCPGMRGALDEPNGKVCEVPVRETVGDKLVDVFEEELELVARFELRKLGLQAVEMPSAKTGSV